MPTTYTLSDLQAECTSTKPGHVLDGAFVAFPAAITSGQENYIIITRSWSRVSFTTAVVECNVATINGPAVTWVSNVDTGIGNRNAASLSPLAVLASIYTILTPSRQTTTVTTRAFPTASPLPVSGAVTGTTSTTQVTSNLGAANSADAALFGFFTGQAANVGSLGSPDAQTTQAVRAAIAALLDGMKSACAAWARTNEMGGGTNATPVLRATDSDVVTPMPAGTAGRNPSLDKPAVVATGPGEVAPQSVTDHASFCNW